MLLALCHSFRIYKTDFKFLTQVSLQNYDFILKYYYEIITSQMSHVSLAPNELCLLNETVPYASNLSRHM